MSKLHIYGQQQWHDEAFIVGSIDALIKLRDGLDRVIKTKEAGGVCTSTSDGEGYDVIIIPNDNEQTWEEMYLPYHDFEMCPQRSGGITPYKLCDVRKIKKGLHKEND